MFLFTLKSSHCFPSLTSWKREELSNFVVLWDQPTSTPRYPLPWLWKLGQNKVVIPKKNGIESISWSRNWRLRVVQNIGSSNVVLWINTNLKYYKMCLLTHHQFWRLHRLLNGQHNLKTEMNKGKIVWLNKCDNQGMNILYSPARTKEWYRSVKDKMTRFLASITISEKVTTEGFKPMNHSSKTVLTGLLYPRQLIC